LDFIKLKIKILSDTVKGMKRQAMQQKSIFAKHRPEKWLVSEINNPSNSVITSQTMQFFR
jgi:hypothetical protein